ncbi:DNA-binding protein [Candidatus Thorarchaeota archaeon]|nr:MAG: DNA-binding protein [Candidatus Thorarchaeota archaeon]
MPGEDILESIETVADEYGIKSAQISLIGAIKHANLGYFDRHASEYRKFSIDEDLEVVSCLGNISRLRDGEVVVHAHMIVADEHGNCHGGHLMKGCVVSVTIEVIIMELEAEIYRDRDKKTGLNLLDI